MNAILKNRQDARILIAKKGKSLREFANEVEISHTYLSQILNGKRSPSPTVAYKIANGLGFEIDDLFRIEHKETIKI